MRGATNIRKVDYWRNECRHWQAVAWIVTAALVAVVAGLVMR